MLKNWWFCKSECYICLMIDCLWAHGFISQEERYSMKDFMNSYRASAIEYFKADEDCFIWWQHDDLLNRKKFVKFLSEIK